MEDDVLGRVLTMVVVPMHDGALRSGSDLNNGDPDHSNVKAKKNVPVLSKVESLAQGD